LSITLGWEQFPYISLMDRPQGLPNMARQAIENQQRNAALTSAQHAVAVHMQIAEQLLQQS
jgi:hypothetical protein